MKVFAKCCRQVALVIADRTSSQLESFDCRLSFFHQQAEVKYGFIFDTDPEVLAYHPGSLASNQESSLCLNFSFFFFGNLLF